MARNERVSLKKQTESGDWHTKKAKGQAGVQMEASYGDGSRVLIRGGRLEKRIKN